MNKDVIDVKPLAECGLLLSFEGGERRDVDIAKIVSFYGVFEPLNDAAYSRQVTVNPDIGTIVWPNGADLCPDMLYSQSLPTSSPRLTGSL